MILTLCLFLVLLAAPTLEQNAEDPTPCRHVFMYGPSRAKPGRWYGVINLSTQPNLHSLLLEIELDSEAWVLGNSIGNVSSDDNKKFRIEISPGPAVPVYFYVQYNPLSITPSLQTITLNGSVICVAFHPEPGAFERVALRILFSPKSSNPKGIDAKPKCGNVVANKTVLNGKSKLDTQWPWQIALYKDEGMGNNYACGGTLITARHVITAAQCVTMESTEHAVEHYTLSVFLGIHDLWTSSDEVQIRFVQNIIVHPYYNASTYKRNLAILELNQHVKYTDWVKPACLWPKNDIDLKNIIGKKGLLLSWRFDDKDKVIDDLKQEEVPVVSQATCIKSHERMVLYTSEYTYCAGNSREKSSCASAGSGMVFKLGSTWYLRGLASLAIPGYNGKRCDTTHYVIFTDLAKFLPWINSIVFDF